MYQKIHFFELYVFMSVPYITFVCFTNVDIYMLICLTFKIQTSRKQNEEESRIAVLVRLDLAYFLGLGMFRVWPWIK